MKAIQGNARWSLWASTTSLLLVLTFLLLLLLSIEDMAVLTQRYGHLGLGEWLGWSLPEPVDGRLALYRQVVATALSASEISLLQLFLIFTELYLGIRLILIWLGISASGARIRLEGTVRFMEMAMIVLPALGMLSTVVGVLSSSRMEREAVKIMIFGPTGIGIIGYLLAAFLHALGEQVSE
ncbi:MAG: hypothetical protein ABW168_08205 [Sedimenticola sp.]